MRFKQRNDFDSTCETCQNWLRASRTGQIGCDAVCLEAQRPDRRACVRGCVRAVHYARHSAPRWALAFSRSNSTFSDGEGPGAAPENTYTKYPPKMGFFKNFPYDFPKNLHTAPNW